MRIIARKTLRDFVESLHSNKDQKAVKAALDAWFHEARNARWETPVAVMKSYANASIVGDDRVVFNIKGNSFRLIVAIHFNRKMVFVLKFLTHAEYTKNLWKRLL